MNSDRKVVLLFNPATWRGVGDATAPWGLMALATYLHPDFEVVLLDHRFDARWPQETRRLLSTGRVVAAAATAMTGLQIRSSLSFLRWVKRHGDVPTFFGGMHASMLPVQTVSEPSIDYVVVGEGETVFNAAIRRLADGKPLEGWGGSDAIVWKGKADYRFAVENDLDALPFPPVELFPLERYITSTRYGRMLSVLTSRGCPHGCHFCIHSNPKLPRKWRAMDAHRALQWMDHLHETYRVDHFHIQDDNFFVNTHRVQALVDELLKTPREYTFTIGGAHIQHLRRFDEAFFLTLKKVGCTRLLIGAESGSQAVLDRIGKHQTADDVRVVNRHLLASGIRPIYSFVCGIPDETDEDLKASVSLMKELRQENRQVDVGTIKPLIFYPGTSFYQWALDHGYNPPTSLEGWTHVSWDHYLELPYPWLSQERKKFFLDLYYTSLLWNPEYHWVNSPLFTWPARVLMPLTDWRMRHLEFRGAILPSLLRLVQHKALSRPVDTPELKG